MWMYFLLILVSRRSSNSNKTFGFAAESKDVGGGLQKDKIVRNSCDSNLVLAIICGWVIGYLACSKSKTSRELNR